MPTDTAELTPQQCLVALMIAVSASDEHMRTSELVTIQRIVNHLPVFRDFDQSGIGEISHLVFTLFEAEDGLDQLFTLLRDRLPEKLNETAYALACDVAAADGAIEGPEARILEEIRYELDIGRLHAAAIERGTRARHMTV